MRLLGHAGGNLTTRHHGKYEGKKWDVVVSHCGNAHAHNYKQRTRHSDRERGRRSSGVGGQVHREKRRVRKEVFKETCTSILRPSTTVPCNFSLALSASTLCSNVTNPKPCMQERKRRGRGWGQGGGKKEKEHIIVVKIRHQKYLTISNS